MGLDARYSLSYLLSCTEQTSNAVSNLLSNNAFHLSFLTLFYNIPIMSNALSFIKVNLILF